MHTMYKPISYRQKSVTSNSFLRVEEWNYMQVWNFLPVSFHEYLAALFYEDLSPSLLYYLPPAPPLFSNFNIMDMDLHISSLDYIQ